MPLSMCINADGSIGITLVLRAICSNHLLKSLLLFFSFIFCVFWPDFIIYEYHTEICDDWVSVSDNNNRCLSRLFNVIFTSCDTNCLLSYCFAFMKLCWPIRYRMGEETFLLQSAAPWRLLLVTSKYRLVRFNIIIKGRNFQSSPSTNMFRVKIILLNLRMSSK